ncbi:hypothetical protein MMC34_001537 [Xylographa carneopallida]|nr:hypothetical protein [Xylographa carneopallida]
MDHSSLEAPEVRKPSEPEVLWDPLEHPPEVELGQGLEAAYDGLQHDGETQPEPALRTKTKLSWRWLSFIALISAATIGGSLGGALSKRLTSSTSSNPTASQAPLAQPTASSLPSSPKFHTILENTSIASTTCPNGDRWIFFQDTSGSIRQAQYPADGTIWRVASNGTIPSIPRAGTPLSATCVEVPLNFEQMSRSDYPGQDLSYVPTSGLWSQDLLAILNDQFWQDYPTWPTLFAPANNTKLSASSNLEPLILEGRTTNATHYAGSILYQSTNGSIVMVDLDPIMPSVDNVTDYDSANPPIEPNIISTFLNSSAHEVPNHSTSLSCIYNAQTASWFPLQFFTACYIAETMNGWYYNQSDMSDINGIGRMNQSASACGNSQNTTKEVNLVVVDELALAIVSLLPNQTITSSIINPYIPPPMMSPYQTVESSRYYGHSSSWSTQIPFDHISATSLSGNATLIYVYYQANDSSLAEIYYDTANAFWPSVPTYIVVP